MATVAGELVYKITGDSSGLNKNLKAADQSVSKMNGALNKFALVAAGAFSIGAIVSFGKAIVKSASDAEETAQKFGVVFSSIAGQANDAAAAIAAGYGLSNQQAKELLSTTGNVLQSMGATQQASLTLSQGITQLSADLVSFTNYSGGVEGASQAITSALLGEREALKSLGIAISDADLKAYAEAQGKVYDQLTKSQQAQLTYNLILAKSKNAIGDYARSSESYANSVRRLEAAWGDFSSTLGKSLLPVMASIARKLASLLDGFSQLMAMNSSDARTQITALDKSVEQYRQHIEKLKEAQAKAPESAFFTNTKKDYDRFIKNTQAQIDELLRQKAELEKTVPTATAKSAPAAATPLSEELTALKETKPDKNNWSIWGDDVKESFARAQVQAESLRSSLDVATQSFLSAAGGVQVFKNASSDMEKLTAGTMVFNDALGVTAGILTSIQNLQNALTEKRLADLELERQATLEAAGVAEDTAVEKAQKEYDAAVAAGDAATVLEKKKALERAKINEDFDKRKAKLEYEAALRSWHYQVAFAAIDLVRAPLTAFVSALATPIIGPEIAPIAAALAGVQAGIQYAAVEASRPTAPKFANGGIVPGSSFTGDNVLARVNSGEMVLNQQQQARLFAQANGGGAGTQIIVNIGPEQLYNMLHKATQNGELIIDTRAVK